MGPIFTVPWVSHLTRVYCIHLAVNNTKIITRSDIVWKMFWLLFWEFSYQDYFVNFITNHFQNLFLLWHSNRSNAFENVFSKKSCWKNLLVLIRIVRNKTLIIQLLLSFFLFLFFEGGGKGGDKTIMPLRFGWYYIYHTRRLIYTSASPRCILVTSCDKCNITLIVVA